MPHVATRPQGAPEEPAGPRVLGGPGGPVPVASPAAVGPVGKWQGFHPSWSGILEIRKDGWFFAPFAGGKWFFDGKRLILAWSGRAQEFLDLQPDGTFRAQQAGGTFSLRK